MKKKKGPAKKFINLLTGVVVGGAVGSILGLTLAPKKGSETRKYLSKRSRNIEDYLHGDLKLDESKKINPIKKMLIKILTPKKKK